MNLIFITIDGARVDRIVQGKNYCKLIEKSAFFQTTITYAPFTIAALHAVFSGTYGNHTGVNSYWSTPNFKKDKLNLSLHPSAISDLFFPKSFIFFSIKNLFRGTKLQHTSFNPLVIDAFS